MKEKISEQAMVIKFCQYLEMQNVSFTVEVPFLHRSIDLVYTDSEWSYYAIEFKLKDWKKAIIQASDYIMGADHALICIPKNIFNEKIEVLALQNGVWIILFDYENGKFETIKSSNKTGKYDWWFLIKKGFQYACHNQNYQLLLSLS